MEVRISFEEKAARKIVQHFIQSDLPEGKKKIIVYGWSVLLLNLIKLLLIIGIAALFHVLPETLVAFASYTLLRIYAYGFHAKSNANCTWISILMFNIVPLAVIYGLNQVAISQWELFVILGIGFIVNGMLLYHYGPIHKRKNWKAKDYRKKRNQALGMLILLAMLAFGLHSEMYSCMILLGTTICVFFLTPIVNIIF